VQCVGPFFFDGEAQSSDGPFSAAESVKIRQAFSSGSGFV
jgi:hypothetical protein